jgi:hypothetical protein
MLLVLALVRVAPAQTPPAAPVATSGPATPAAQPKPVAADGTYAVPTVKELLSWQSIIKNLLPGGVYSLNQFGSVANKADAQAAFDAAEKHITASGGGVLFIPIETDWSWEPRTPVQHQLRSPEPPAPTKQWRSGVGMTVVDLRGNNPTILPPMVNGLTIKRVVDLKPGDSLPHWGYFPLIDLQNTIAFGSTSYHDWVQEDSTGGNDDKIYIATVRGLFPGMFITANAWSTAPRLCIKSLGYAKDKNSWYVVADTPHPIKKGAILSNKSHTNIVKLETRSHNENQTFDLCLWRHNYSQGDNYLIDARFKYTGDIHSTAGDENGVIFGGFVEGHDEFFKAKVSAWNAQTGELKFNTATANDTLGSGRPIINVNPAKAITDGAVWIVRPGDHNGESFVEDDPVFQGKSYPTKIEKNKLGNTSLNVGGLIRFNKQAPVTPEVVGRYFALTQADEVTKKGKAKRWYLIDSVTMNPDGTKDIRIVRHWWGAKSAGSPNLYNPGNYSYDGREVPLKYVIAPGVNAFDVSRGLPGQGITLRLAPSPSVGTKFDFEPNDPIEQAIGPDPFHPQIMRSWTWDIVPSSFPASVLDFANLGDVQRHSVMVVRGGSGNLEKDIKDRYSHSTVYNRLLDLQATSNNAVIFAGDVANAALMFNQPNNRAQPIKWNFGADAANKVKPTTASLTVAPDTGVMTLDAPSVALPKGVTRAAGLSGTEIRANNLRGIKVPVKAGAKELVVTFPKPETDDDYAVFVELTWPTVRTIVSQTAEGFTVKFETAPTADAKLHWFVVR